jgi:hypothetical protein
MRLELSGNIKLLKIPTNALILLAFFHVEIDDSFDLHFGLNPSKEKICNVLSSKNWILFYLRGI